MKKILAATAALAVLATGLATGATAAQARTQQERSEERLARMLEGFEAGESQTCIHTTRSNRLEVIPYVGLVYDDGDTIYVARATHPRMLDNDDVPIIERFSSQLCRMDVMRTVDRHMPSMQGALFIEDFVAYHRVAPRDNG